MSRWRSTSAAAAGAVCLLVGLAASAPPRGASEGIVLLTSPGRAPDRSSSGTFTVRGQSVSGLYPGVVRTMALTLTNPYDFDLRVTGLTGRVTSSSRRRCVPGRATVAARAYTGELPLVLRARTKRKVGSIPIAMAGSAPAGCSDTTFSVLLVGHATRARR